VFEEPEMGPLAWVVRTVFPVATAAEGMAMVAGDLDLKKHAFTVGAAPKVALPGANCGAGDKVMFIEQRGGHAQVNVKLDCEGLVVLGETYFPGWTARVDERAAQVYEVNGMMRGVIVPAGEHAIMFDYRPDSVKLGGALTLAAFVGLIALGWLKKDGADKAGVERVNHVP
jgi:hypothetical protein